jgi:hypothetical protein
VKAYKSSILLILFISISLNFSAQVFKAGLLAGLSGAQIEGDGYAGYKKLGFIAGGFTNTNLSEKWSTQFEIYFINKGSFKAAHPDKGDYKKFSLNLNYIEVPLAIRYKYEKFMFEFGPYLSKFLSYKFEDEFGVRKQGFTQYPIKSFDFGGFIGVNYELKEHLIFNLRSKNSLIPIRDFETADQTIGILNKLFNSGWYNVDINFSIRYQFGE